ncbi:MAG TPA: hypothetical protein PLD20_00930 [Blastocatellia bacterium]|nr:hypothetical protein [Blastocatellia bacterium]HMV81811.1 hypothetical protein [Blastocatellia bacterium]HMX24008.1 hypothetical protein [Blastocatellia bacterium]HMY70438.1 hypothetical protein [Blastocatellia bacterium]HMZ16499.1 hypothetical protein [Blastocatellia bacterium]
MADVKISIDTDSIEQLGEDLDKASRGAMISLLAQAKKHIRREAPKRTGRLKGEKVNESISAEPVKTSDGYLGEVTVSAISERRNARTAVLHLQPKATLKPQTRKVSLAPQPAFDYAEAVARGRKAIRPRKGKALLIPVTTAPLSGSYITEGKDIFVVRPSARAVPANPYDERALRTLEEEAPEIVEAALARFGLLR